MLRYMRENAGSWVIKLLLFGIVVVFAFWGVGSYTNESLNTVLTIDKVKVPYSEYRDAYNALIDTYRELFDQLDADIIKELDLKEQAVETLVDRYLLMEAAKKLDVSTSADEVTAAIVQNSSFQEGGVFSPRLYQAYLDYNRVTSESFEAGLARDITVRKVMELIQLSAVVTPQEVEENLDLLTRKAVLDVLVLDPNLFLRDLSPASEEDLLDYYDDNIESYRIPEKFTQAVVVIDTEELKSDLPIPEEEIEDWYADREEEYTEPASFKLRHILFAFPASATTESITETRNLAEQVATRINDGEITFEEAARKWSGDGATAATGGELGFMSEDELDAALADAALSLEKGEISEPIPTSRGFEIIGVMDMKEERVRPLGEVREEIRTLIMEDRVIEAAYDMADDLIDRVQDGGQSLQEIAQAEDLAVFITPPFSRDRLPRAVDLPPALLREVFNTEEDEIGDLFELEGKLYLFQNISRTESYLPELEEVRDQVSAGLMVKQAMELALERGQAMVEDLEEGGSLTVLAKDLGVSLVTTPPFTVVERSLPGLGDVPDLIREAFTINAPGDAVLVEGGQGHYLAVLKEIIPATEEERDLTRKTVEEAVRNQRENDTLTSYIQVLREEYTDRIEINRELL